MGNYLATNLTALRKLKGKTQTELATSVGLKRTTYMNYESGHTEPNLDVASKLASFFGVCIEDLLSRDYSQEGNLMEVGGDAQKGNNSGNVIGNLMPKNDTSGLSDELAARVEANASTQHGQSVAKIQADGLGVCVLVPAGERYNYARRHRKQSYVDSLPVFMLPVTQAERVRLFEVDGDEMAPTMQPQDVAIAHWTPLSELKQDKIHVLVTKNQDVLIKRVSYRLGEGKIICKSDNLSGDKYPVISMNIDDLLESWVCVEKITKHLPAPNEIIERISGLEADMELLKKQLSAR